MPFVSFSRIKLVSIVLIILLVVVSIPFIVCGLWYYSLRNVHMSYEGWKGLSLYRNISLFDRFYSGAFVNTISLVKPGMKNYLLVPESKYPLGVEMKNKPGEYEYSWMGVIQEGKLDLENKDIRYFTVKMDSGEVLTFYSDQRYSTLWEVSEVITSKWTYKMKSLDWTLEYFKPGDRVKVLFKESKDYAISYKKNIDNVPEIKNMFVIRI